MSLIEKFAKALAENKGQPGIIMVTNDEVIIDRKPVMPPWTNGPKLGITSIEATSSGASVSFGDLPKDVAKVEVTFSGISATAPDASDTQT